MPYRTLAEAVVVFHFAVVIFVVAGGLLVVWRRRVAWVHLPVIAWVIFAECFQRMCPLTFLENWLRHRGGDVGVYSGDFVGHYIWPILYPSGLTPQVQVAFGILVFVINAALYARAFQLMRRRRPAAQVQAEPHPS